MVLRNVRLGAVAEELKARPLRPPSARAALTGGVDGVPQDVQGAHAAPLCAAVQPGQQEGQQAVRGAARCRAGVSQAVRTCPDSLAACAPSPGQEGARSAGDRTAEPHAGPGSGGPRRLVTATPAAPRTGRASRRRSPSTVKQRSTSFWLLITRGLDDSTGTQICGRGQRTGQGVAPPPRGCTISRCGAHTARPTRLPQRAGASRCGAPAGLTWAEGMRPAWTWTCREGEGAR